MSRLICLLLGHVWQDFNYGDARQFCLRCGAERDRPQPPPV